MRSLDHFSILWQNRSSLLVNDQTLLDQQRSPEIGGWGAFRLKLYPRLRLHALLLKRMLDHCHFSHQIRPFDQLRRRTASG